MHWRHPPDRPLVTAIGLASAVALVALTISGGLSVASPSSAGRCDPSSGTVKERPRSPHNSPVASPVLPSYT